MHGTLYFVNYAYYNENTHFVMTSFITSCNYRPDFHEFDVTDIVLSKMESLCLLLEWLINISFPRDLNFPAIFDGSGFTG